LRHLNPIYSAGRVPKGHVLHLPEGTSGKLMHALLVQSEIKPTDEVVIDQPTDTIASPPAMEEIKRKEKDPGYTIYTVRPGDSLYVIAKRFPGVSAQTLKDLNGISDKIKPGQKIRIPRP
jgi:LysM repeat protein